MADKLVRHFSNWHNTEMPDRSYEKTTTKSNKS
jgi:hypothetical protein